MWSALAEYLVVSEQLCIITSCIYALKLNVPGKKKCCCNDLTVLPP